MSEAQQVMEAPESRLVTRELFVKFNRADFADIGEKLGALSGDLIKLEEHLKEVQNDLAPKIKQAKEVIKELGAKSDAKGEVRLVECTEIKDFMANTIKYVYDGETLEEVAMTGEQRQAEMFSHTPQILPAEDFKEPNLDPEADLKSVIKEETSRTKFGIV